MFPLLLFGNGSTDCAKIGIQLIRDSLFVVYPVATSHECGSPALAHVRRAHSVSVSQERLGRLCSNLVCC